VSAYPCISLPAALVVLRVSVAGQFMAHAALRIADGTRPCVAACPESIGCPNGIAQVWAIAA
jgi:putative oxidoreductase